MLYEVITNLTAVLILVVAVIGWSALAQAQQSGPAPLEAFYCNYQSGKSMKDLLPVAERFAKWADKNDSDYSACRITSYNVCYTKLLRAPAEKAGAVRKKGAVRKTAAVGKKRPAGQAPRTARASAK